MTIVYEKLHALKIPEVEHSYGPKDCMLYALGVGLGLDPLDQDQLAFVYEKSLKVLTTMAVVLGYPGFWVKELDTGIDWVKVVAGEYALELHQPLAPRGTVVGRTRVAEIVDKGPGKGAVVYAERSIVDKASGAPIATIVQTTFCRGDGGFGGPPGEQRLRELYAHSAFYTWRLLRRHSKIAIGWAILIFIFSFSIIYGMATEPPTASALRKAPAGLASSGSHIRWPSWF
jgi:hypothetical protein